MEITVPFAARALDAVKSVAADEILPRYRNVAARTKPDGSVITDADLAAQEALVRRLTALEPAPVIAEEMAPAEQLAVFERAERFWCIDPLDGTSNFAVGVPFFAVSVALVERGRPLFGAVYDPVADEAFYAVRGAGAYLNHRPLVLPSAGPVLREAVAEVSLHREVKRLRGALKRHPPYAKRLDSGSSALSWCHLAAARVDVLLHGGQMMWDYAAGALVLAEAGGHFRAVGHEDFWAGDAWRRSVIGARTAPLLADWSGWVGRALAAAGDAQ